MCFSHLCGESMGLLSIQIKLPFNDMLDKSWFQHAYNSEPKTFLISRTNRDRKDVNFLTNKRWAGSYLSSQRVGGTYTGHIAAKKEHRLVDSLMFALLQMQGECWAWTPNFCSHFVDNLEAIETLVADHGPHAPTLRSHAGRTGPEHWPPPPEPGPGNRGPEVSLLNLSSPGTSLTRGVQHWCLNMSDIHTYGSEYPLYMHILKLIFYHHMYQCNI